jgi:hypothetical protein
LFARRFTIMARYQYELDLTAMCATWLEFRVSKGTSSFGLVASVPRNVYSKP